MQKKHDAIVGNIYETRDYEQFKTLLGNRDVEPERFKKIETAMRIKQLPIPIVVNEKMEVIDGQGRLAVCKKHGFPISYIICDGLGIDDCVAANLNFTQWSSKDVVKRYAKTGGADYQRLLELVETYKVSCDDVFNAAGKSNTEKGKREKVRRGELVFTEEDYDKAMQRLEYAEDIFRAIADSGKQVKRKNILRNCIIKCAKTAGYDHKRMKKVCADNAISYRDAGNLPDMLKQLAFFYNKGKRDKFMDTYGTRASLVIVFDEKINKHKTL